MKFSKYCLKAVTFLSWPYFKSSTSCFSNKATTICGYPADNLRQLPVRHNRGGVSAEIKVQFSPPVICRLTSKESATKIIEHIFKVFYAEKNKNMETREASLSVGICVCQKGDSFEECLAKTDKALYYVKQNGKDNYSFYHEISQENMQNTSKKDLEQVAKALRNSGSYTGAFDIEHREFAKLYEYMCNLGERYKHTCHLVMITIDAASNDNMLIEKQEKAMECMEIAVLSNIRNVDICTRYSSIQYLVMLVESREENIPSVMERIFSQYYKLYKHNEFHPAYEFLSMLPAWNESKE